MSKAAVVHFPEVKKTRLYYVDKKTNKQKRLSDNIFRDLQYVTRANDPSKRISLKARNLLTNLLQMILKNPHKEEFVNHDFLCQITEVGSSRQNINLLDQINDIIDCTYHSYINFQGKSRTYGYVVKLTDDGYERAKNPVAFYTDSSGKKFPSESKKISTRVEKNFQIYKEEENPIEEINSSYAREFISEKEKIYKKEKAANDPHATFASGFPSEPAQVASTDEKIIEQERKNRSSENTGISSVAELMVKLLNKPEELSQQEEIPEMKREEIPQITDKQERAMLLSKALYGTFGEQRSNEIQDDYKFVEKEPQKVCIQTKAMLLNDIEKAKIRKCIQSVYGEDVTIAMQLIETKQEVAETIPSYQKQSFQTFKAAIPDTKVITLLTNPLVKAAENSRGIIIEAAPFFIDQLTEAGNMAVLEDAVVKTRITLELNYKRTSNYKGTSTEYANIVKKPIADTPIVLIPEQILKDREWLENHRK